MLGVLLVLFSSILFDVDNSLGVSVAWKSTRGQEMVGHLSHVIILLCLGIYYPYFKLVDYMLCSRLYPYVSLTCLCVCNSERSRLKALPPFFGDHFPVFINV